MHPLIVLVVNETYKSFLRLWYFRTNGVGRLLNFAFQFIGLMFVFYRGHIDATGLNASLSAYCLWIVAFYLFADMSWGIIDEMQAGTLEQLYMTPLPTTALWIASLFSSFAVAAFNVIIMALFLKLVLGVTLSLSFPVLLIFLCTLPGLMGVALLLGGLTFKIKRTESLVGLTYNALIYLSGAIVPLSLFPASLRAWTYWAPGSPGIDLMRWVLTKQASSLELIQDGRIFLVLAHALAILAIGAFLFKVSEKSLRKTGNYGIY